jgi:hypothetical protein
MTRVRVRRERPTALALAVALCVTMLVVYVLTLDVKGPDAVQSMAAAPRVTKEIAFDDLSGWAVSMAACESQQAARLQALLERLLQLTLFLVLTQTLKRSFLSSKKKLFQIRYRGSPRYLPERDH